MGDDAAPPARAGVGPAGAGVDAGGGIQESAGLRPALALLTRDPATTGLFFDLDGVLADIRPSPDEVTVPVATLALLARLCALYMVTAVVSGRPGDDVARLIPVPGLVLAGSHGAELLWRGRWERLPVIGRTIPAADRVADRVADRAADRVADRGQGPGGDAAGRAAAASLGYADVAVVAAGLRADPDLLKAGVTVEAKPYSVALHVRGALDPAAALAAARRAAEAVRTRTGLEILGGRQVVELRPPGIDKGSAVEVIVERAGLEAALYVGDDLTDLDAMAALGRLRATHGLDVVTAAVFSHEAPLELLEAADLVIGLEQVGPLLEALAGPGAER